MKTKNILLCLLAVALLPSLALAKKDKEGKGGKGFGKLDRNGDQIISLNEAQAANAERLIENYSIIDTDSSGGVTKEEMREHFKQRMAERRSKREAMDTDGNGSISLEEAKAAGADRLVEHFGKIDRDGNGEITREEMKQAGQAMRKKMKDKGEV